MRLEKELMNGQAEISRLNIELENFQTELQELDGRWKAEVENLNEENAQLRKSLEQSSQV
jgi:predicted RNase H-like nuclease (RuvC/YqgF family)